MNSVLKIFAVMVCTGFALPQHQKIKVFLAGDSTMSIKEVRAYPETGWGMPFAHFFDSTVKVDNRAKNGRSTRTFIEEGLWDKLMADVKAGDYVFIQFGHNDESPDKVDRYTSPEQYKVNITRFVNETRAKNAQPILLTPVSRRKFKDGKQLETHEVYSSLVRQLASQLQVPMIDLDKKSQDLYQHWGEEKSKLLFLQLEPNEHPNYPEGKTDNTHFTELGARKIAQIVLAALREQHFPLADHIVKPAVKK